MKRQLLHQKIHFPLLLLIAFTLPLFTVINTYIIVLFALNWLLLDNYNEKFHLLKQQKLSWLFIGFFVIHLIGLIYSDNISEGIKDVQQKLSLLIFPLILASIPKMSELQIRNIGAVFGAGVLLATVICAIAAIAGYIEKGTTTGFFYHELAAGIEMNAIYLSLYCTFFLLLLLRHLYFNTSRIPFLILAAWITLFIVLLNSKLFIFITFMSINIFIFFLIKKQKSIILAISGMVGCNLLLLLLIFQLKPVQQRFTTEALAPLDVVTQERYSYDTPFSGYTLRLTFWRFALEVLQEQRAYILGVGTGDAQQLLDQKYKERNIFTGDSRRGDTGYLGWNLHNQFFQVLLYAGIIGLIIFISVLAIPFLISLQQRQWLYTFFLLLIISISFTESFLETHKGVVFFSFFNALFAFHYLNNGNKILNSK